MSELERLRISYVIARKAYEQNDAAIASGDRARLEEGRLTSALCRAQEAFLDAALALPLPTLEGGQDEEG